MTLLADRRDMWTALAREAASLAQDYEASFIADADHAGAAIDMRLSALRGQTRGLSYRDLPFPHWDAGKVFVEQARAFASEMIIPARRLVVGPELRRAAEFLIEALENPPGRVRADLEG